MEEDEVYRAILERIDSIGRKIDEFPNLMERCDKILDIMDGIGKKMDEHHKIIMDGIEYHRQELERLKMVSRTYVPFGRFPEVKKYMGRVRKEGNRLVPISYRQTVEEL